MVMTRVRFRSLDLPCSTKIPFCRRLGAKRLSTPERAAALRGQSGDFETSVRANRCNSVASSVALPTQQPSPLALGTC